MGCKLESYIDDAGNIVKDGDQVLVGDKEYTVIYISHLYVNLSGHKNLHLPFTNGVPRRKIPNAPPSLPKLWGQMSPEERGALLLARHEGKGIQCFSSVSAKWLETGPSWYPQLAYRVKPEPRVETVTLLGSTGRNFTTNYSPFDTHRITFKTVDGEPDLSSIKMEKL